MRQIYDEDGEIAYVLETHKADIPILIPTSPKEKCKFRYNTPIKAAKKRKQVKSKRRIVKQSRKHNR